MKYLLILLFFFTCSENCCLGFSLNPNSSKTEVNIPKNRKKPKQYNITLIGVGISYLQRPLPRVSYELFFLIETSIPLSPFFLKTGQKNFAIES